MTAELDARIRLARDIERGASVLSSRVVEAFLNVPRHPFVPAFYRSEDGVHRPWRSGDEGWLRAVYADEVLVTEVDGVHAEDAPASGVGGVATSSSTAPGLMAEMLDALDVRPGDRVLEVGTGTGYNAALLCHLAGAGNVTTVDRTGRLADTARERLAGAGFAAAVVRRADGAVGCPGGGPYDRIIATCSVRRLPPAWLDQCVTGGLIVAPIGNALGGGAVACLTKLPDGGAAGRFLHRPAAFMPLRADGSPAPAHDVPVAGRQRTSVVGARVLDDHGFSFWAGLRLPPAVVRSGGTLHDPNDGSTVHVQDHPDHPGRPSTVTTGGPRDLWQIIEAAYTTWRRHHRPRREWFTLTAAPGGPQLVTYTTPDGGTTSCAL
ncbi:methyltransferase domain-containing protein [Kitasatospora sp. NPDC004723]|uniref:methyltransferase domain-containing protein n=1 Tax=Kitasatospora sp. NPDC004723 TaxID=3154288 RepID=UPI0033A68F44